MTFLALFLALQISPQAARLLGEGRTQEAVRVMEAELDLYPRRVELRRSLVECQLSLRAYAGALRRAPRGAGCDDLRARALVALGRYEEALEVLDPDDGRDVLLIGDALEALGRLDEAERALERASAVLGEDHERVLVWRGRTLARRGRPDEARVCFERALARDPIDPTALFGLGRALVALGRQEEGLAVLQRHRELLPLLDRLEFRLAGIALDPGHAPNHAALGDVERELGRTERADEAYRNAIRLARPEQLTPIALRRARLFAEDRNDLQGALAVLRAAQARVSDVRLFVREGDLCEQEGDLDGARAAWSRAAALEPRDPALKERLQRVRER